MIQKGFQVTQSVILPENSVESTNHLTSEPDEPKSIKIYLTKDTLLIKETLNTILAYKDRTDKLLWRRQTAMWHLKGTSNSLKITTIISSLNSSSNRTIKRVVFNLGCILGSPRSTLRQLYVFLKSLQRTIAWSQPERSTEKTTILSLRITIVAQKHCGNYINGIWILCFVIISLMDSHFCCAMILPSGGFWQLFK